MINKNKQSGILALVTCCALFTAGSAWAQSSPDVNAEQEGTGDAPAGPIAAPDPAAREAALGALGAGGLLLIPESSNDRIMAFDPATGDLIDPDFIPADATNLSTPIEALLSADGTLVYVSDQLDDVVQAFDVNTGAFVTTFAPAGGVDTSILDNVRGMAYRANGNLLVSVGGGTNDDSIAEFDASGNYVGNFVANGSGGLDSPFDVFAVVAAGGSLSAGDFLVPGITSDAVHIYDGAGAYQADLASLNTFGEQVAQAANGNVLVANFSGTQTGIVEFTPVGAVVDIYNPASLSGYRGVFELPNGNLLVTTGSGVHEIDRSSNLVETKISGVSARFISLAGGGADAEPLARFAVEKLFDDGNPGEVEVTISCNTGLPLTQSAMISEGAGVNFVVGDFADGEMNCQIVESAGFDGYAKSYDNGTVLSEEGCAFEDVAFGSQNACTITNSLQPSTFVVTKEWIDENPQFNAQNYAEASFNCSNEQFFDVFGSLSFFGNPAQNGFDVYPHWDGTTTCTVKESVVEGGIEADSSDCDTVSVTVGSDASCTIVNTRLYEGIPTLSQYGLGLLALLMLGMGLVAFRRHG